MSNNGKKEMVILIIKNILKKYLLTPGMVDKINEILEQFLPSQSVTLEDLEFILDFLSVLYLVLEQVYTGNADVDVELFDLNQNRLTSTGDIITYGRSYGTLTSVEPKIIFIDVLNQEYNYERESTLMGFMRKVVNSSYNPIKGTVVEQLMNK